MSFCYCCCCCSKRDFTPPQACLKSRVCEVTRLVEEAGMIKVSTAFGGSGFILAETDGQTDVHAKADQEWRLKSSWLPGTLSVRSCNKDKGFHRNMSQIP